VGLTTPYRKKISLLRKFITSLGPGRIPWINDLRWAEHVAQMDEKRNACRILMGKPEGKKPLGRRRHRWVDNIKIDFRQDRMVWTGLIWLRIGTSGGLL
jgi:hypothetical protein